MKKILKKINNFFSENENKLLASILGILGFSGSCIPAAEYGVPSADYILSGTVKSSETQNPVENIQVIMSYDTAQTDQFGFYSLKITDFPEDMNYQVQFNDIDSSQNGNYTDKTVSVQFFADEISGGDDHWYEGSTSQTLNVELDPEIE